MDLARAVEIVVARTGNPRFRDLVNPEHPAYAPEYIPFVLRRAGALPSPTSHPDRPTVAKSWDLTRAMHACPYRSVRPGCCAGARCALRKGDVVSYPDCFACLKRYG